MFETRPEPFFSANPSSLSPRRRSMPTNPKALVEIGRKQRLELLNALRRSGAEGLSVKALAAQFGMSYMGIKQHCLRLEKDGYLETERRHQPVGRPELIYRLSPRAYGLVSSAPPDVAAGGAGGGSCGGAPRPAARLVLDLLAAVRHTYGASAPEKLLFALFSRRAEDYAAELPPRTFSLADRAAALVRIRDAEGHMSSLETAAAAANGTAASPVLAPAGNGRGEEFSNGGGNGHGHTPRMPSASSAASATAGGETLRIVEHDSPLADLLPKFPLLARLEAELFERVLFCPVQRVDESASGRYRCVFRLGR